MNKLDKLDVKYEILNEVQNDERFAKVKIWVAHTGWNLNDTYFSKQTLANMMSTIKYIPIVGFTVVEDGEADFAGHEEIIVVNDDNELKRKYLGKAIGFIPADNKAKFEMKSENGIDKEWLTVEGIVWNKWEESNLLNGKKSHSMELLPDTIYGRFDEIDDRAGYIIEEAVFDALCALGDNHTPAMSGSIIEKVNFSSFKAQFEKMVSNFSKVNIDKYLERDEWGTGDSISIDLSKESASNDAWGDIDKVDLRNDLLKASNYETLIEETYMVVPDDWDKAPSEELKYPVTQIKNDTLVYNINGVQSASAYMAQDRTEVPEYAIEKLKDIREKLGLERDFTKGGENVDKEKLMELINSLFEDMENVEYVSHNDEAVYGYDYENEKFVGIDYKVEDEEVDFSDEKYDVKLSPVKDDDKFSIDLNIDFVRLNSVQEKIKDFESTIEAKDEEINDLKEKFDTLKEEKEELAQFKAKQLKEDKLSYVKNVANLEDAERDELVENIDNFTFQELEDEVAKVIGKKAMKFSVEDDKDVVNKFSKKDDKKVSGKSYADLVEKYNK